MHTVCIYGGICVVNIFMYDAYTCMQTNSHAHMKSQTMPMMDCKLNLYLSKAFSRLHQAEKLRSFASVASLPLQYLTAL